MIDLVGFHFSKRWFTESCWNNRKEENPSICSTLDFPLFQLTQPLCPKAYFIALAHLNLSSPPNFCHTFIFLLTLNNLDTALLLLKYSAHFQLKSNSTYQLTNYIDLSSHNLLCIHSLHAPNILPYLLWKPGKCVGFPYGKMSREIVIHEIQIDAAPQYWTLACQTIVRIYSLCSMLII